MSSKNHKLKANVYAILNDCVSNGIEAGWNKAHKHTDRPTADHVKDMILNYIMNEIGEKFKFD